ncbi:hypothetical protein KFL_006280030 [Klebsormidium nitens]|uniref:Uncharacterized protein n=1 Tax=Klebsormidium nitens TaxID=105231 RepID=A0A1Y1IQB2_KLENI|nr:hypothetical protein KFL_006280030 [Klebsormidium nitens]|eukprot:GAQ90328.1 hypothetical protein KFL_006280030 [Klebsormidium nitens]
MLGQGEVEKLWAGADLLVECTSTDDVHYAPVTDESGWSELLSEVLSQHVLLPACLREKVSGFLGLIVQFLEGQTHNELTSDLDSLLDGVDLSAVLPSFSGHRPEDSVEHKNTAINGGLLKDLLPHLKSLQTATEDRAMETARNFLRSESMKGVVRVLRRAFRCVDSGMLVRLLSDAVEKLDVGSVPALIASVQALQDDPNMVRGVAMLTRTANVPALQALVQDAAQLVDPSVMQKVIGGGTGGSNVLSNLLSASATPDIGPTAQNPMGNFLMNEYEERPDRPSGCDPADVRDEIDAQFYQGLYRDQTDIYENANAQRQFYQTPVTTVCNDQRAFGEIAGGLLWGREREPVRSWLAAACLGGRYRRAQKPDQEPPERRSAIRQEAVRVHLCVKEQLAEAQWERVRGRVRSEVPERAGPVLVHHRELLGSESGSGSQSESGLALLWVVESASQWEAEVGGRSEVEADWVFRLEGGLEVKSRAEEVVDLSELA